VEEGLFDRHARVAAFQFAGAIVLNALREDQILSASRFPGSAWQEGKVTLAKNAIEWRTQAVYVRWIFAHQAGAPLLWNLVCSRSGSMATTSHPVPGLNAALSSA
jgi:hypothetical protein